MKAEQLFMMFWGMMEKAPRGLNQGDADEVNHVMLSQKAAWSQEGRLCLRMQSTTPCKADGYLETC